MGNMEFIFERIKSDLLPKISNIVHTHHIVYYWWRVVLPIICLCSIATSVHSVRILHKLRHVNRLYRLLYVKTLINLVYLNICFWAFLAKFGPWCPRDSNQLMTFGIQLYKHFILGYVGSVLAYSDLLIEIIVSVERYKLLNDAKTKTKVPTSCRNRKDEKWPMSFGRQMAVVFAASAIVYMASLVLTRLDVIEDDVHHQLTFPYRLYTAHAELDGSIRTFTSVFMRSLPTLLLVLCINVINFLHVKRQPNTGDDDVDADRELKRMLFNQSLLFVLGNLPTAVSHTILFAWPDVDQYVSLRFQPLVNNTLLMSSLGLNYFLWRKRRASGEAVEQHIAKPSGETSS